jgi:hypothetical protein
VKKINPSCCIHTAPHFFFNKKFLLIEELFQRSIIMLLSEMRNLRSSKKKERKKVIQMMRQMYFPSCLQIISPAVSDMEFQKYKDAKTAVTQSTVYSKEFNP